LTAWGVDAPRGKNGIGAGLPSGKGKRGRKNAEYVRLGGGKEQKSPIQTSFLQEWWLQIILIVTKRKKKKKEEQAEVKLNLPSGWRLKRSVGRSVAETSLLRKKGAL